MRDDRRMRDGAEPAGRRSVHPLAGPGAHLLVSGGAGFIGSCFVREVLGRRDGTRITVLDKLTVEDGKQHTVVPRWLAVAPRVRAIAPSLYRRLARRFG